MGVIKIGLCGSGGRMGIAIENLLQTKTERFILQEKLGSSHTEAEMIKFCKNSDVIIDFSNPDILKNLTKMAASYKTRIVVGTTGLKEKHFKYLEALSTQVAVLYAANTSLGANLVAILAAKSAKLLKEYDVEIIEAHHKHKKDAPSGTALMIGRKIADEINVNFKDHAVFDRAGKGVRHQGEIGFSSIRGGGIYGENEVIFAGENEVISVGCRALSRAAFADGALFAAQWISDKNPGLYSMQDALQL